MKITMIREHYEKTASGKNWKSKPYETETEEISIDNYRNRASKESIKFMNGFCGGKCWAEYGYNYIGYSPIKITLVAPHQTEKIVERFKFSKDYTA